MKYRSTRGQVAPVALTDALSAGLAPDGGLFVPEQWPHFELEDFDGADEPAAVGERLLRPFFKGSELADDLGAILVEALNFPLPTVATGEDGLSVLELFHGPTAAFKDVGARFLAGCLSRLPEAEREGLTVLVATSGDTGGAVAAAFEGRPVRVAILFPHGGVSPRQEHQLCCWQDPIVSFRIEGAFDDCQRLVKAAFLDSELAGALRLTSANSISIGRLLPQMIYYAHASLQRWRDTGQRANFIIPTGNLGNALACLWARHLGLPIGHVVFATNANRAVPRYLESGRWQPKDTIATLASAMDVGDPSNMERLLHLWPEFDDLVQRVQAWSVDDATIRQTIRWAWQVFHMAVCPHTATGLEAWRQLRAAGDTEAWIVAATAHPAKFETIVEPEIDSTVPLPPALAALLERPRRQIDLEASLDALRSALLSRFRQH